MSLKFMENEATIIICHGTKLQPGKMAYANIFSKTDHLKGNKNIKYCHLNSQNQSLYSTVNKLYSEGIRKINIVTLLLFEGAHFKKDIEAKVKELNQVFNEISFKLHGYLSSHEGFCEMISEILNETLKINNRFCSEKSTLLMLNVKSQSKKVQTQLSHVKEYFGKKHNFANVFLSDISNDIISNFNYSNIKNLIIFPLLIFPGYHSILINKQISALKARGLSNIILIKVLSEYDYFTNFILKIEKNIET